MVTIPAAEAAVLEALPFFMLGTVDATGAADCSHRGRMPRGEAGLRGEEGTHDPLVKVTGPRRLVFPDYKGNAMFNSLGNLIQRPAVSLLFLDFARGLRLRVDGDAVIHDDPARWPEAWHGWWPAALRCIEVAVTGYDAGCVGTVPRLRLDEAAVTPLR
jgi:predicted pyridoxine 5'-phosphate oxidase superfamily flavin-nucleotide-binding protein